MSNTEIWDLRTFHLLRTVAALDHQHVLFSTPESALYTYSFEQENDEDTTFESSFKTLDSSDYSSIGTNVILFYLSDSYGMNLIFAASLQSFKLVKLLSNLQHFFFKYLFGTGDFLNFKVLSKRFTRI